MNAFWIAAGAMATIGGLAHMILGERWILSRVDNARLDSSLAGDEDTLKRYIRWFWHVGTTVFLFTAVSALLIGIGEFSHKTTIAKLLALQGVVIVAAYLWVAVPRPWIFIRIPQGTAIAIVSLLLWLGS